MIRTHKIPTITGNTSGTTNRPVNGRVLAVYLDYNITPNVATDVTIATSGFAAPANTILTVTDSVTDGWFYPRHEIDDEAGAAVLYAATFGVHEAVPVDDYIKATVAQGDNDQTLDVWILVEQ